MAVEFYPGRDISPGPEPRVHFTKVFYTRPEGDLVLPTEWVLVLSFIHPFIQWFHSAGPGLQSQMAWAGITALAFRAL